MRKGWVVAISLLMVVSLVLGSQLVQEEEGAKPVDRETKIPLDAVKMTPTTDAFPPVLHSKAYEDPIPVPYPINTAGAEDSPFITPEGDAFYFFFTPDVEVPVEQQLRDGVTGIYVAYREGATWTKPQRVPLQYRDRLALDGCVFVQNDTMWFCSAREGYTGVRFFTAQYEAGRWTQWQYVGDTLTFDYAMGEMHLSADGEELYFHSDREDGKGQLDLWVSTWSGSAWQEPVNLATINSPENEGWPYLSPDGKELWFTRPNAGSPAIYRSQRVDGDWGAPELIVSQFAAEPTLDGEGNLYFTHHYFVEGQMIEADIYVAYRKPQGTVTPADSPVLPTRGFYKDVLPIPAEGQSFPEVYHEATQFAEYVPVWGQPTPFYEFAAVLSGSWGEVFVDELTRGNGLFPLVHLSFLGSNVTLLTPPGLEGATLSDPAWRAQYRQAAIAVVHAVRPRFLSLGNEVNRWYEKYGVNESAPNGFQHFVSLYEEVYDAVKEVSPETQVFCVFARESVATRREADLDVLRLFDPAKIDVLAFTSYPHAVEGITHPEEIPDDYYARVFAYFPEKAMGFSEPGWPSHEAFRGGTGPSQPFNPLRPSIDSGSGSGCRVPRLGMAPRSG